MLTSEFCQEINLLISEPAFYTNHNTTFITKVERIDLELKKKAMTPYEFAESKRVSLPLKMVNVIC